MQLVIRKHQVIRIGRYRAKGSRLIAFAVVITRRTACIQAGGKKLWLYRPNPFIADYDGRPLAVGDVITGWYDDVPYTGTVTAIGPPRPDCAYRDITVRRDDGTDHPTFSHAVVAGRRTV